MICNGSRPPTRTSAASTRIGTPSWVSAVGFYLYRSVEEAMLRRSDVMVAGRVEHFRNLLRDNLTLAELKARPRLFENMLGNEQDILLLGQRRPRVATAGVRGAG